jgi:hypothetical protein
MKRLTIMRNSVQAGFNQPRPDLEVSFHNYSPGKAKASNYSVLIVQNRGEIHACPKQPMSPTPRGDSNDAIGNSSSNSQQNGVAAKVKKLMLAFSKA